MADNGRTIELLAPAGTVEAAHAALANGADAVYLGLSEFNARRNAKNLSLDDLEDVCRLAHVGGQRIYLTLNTALLDRELAQAANLAQQAWERGADAVIVQDLGLLRVLREHLPHIEVHASTQMNIHDARGVELLARLGAKRVTLARELSLDELADLSKLGVELEVFGHGALCVCYSGQCLMSSLIGRRSANRGLCAQACRLPYELVDAQGNHEADPEQVGRYLLSPRDLATIDILPQLIDAGVASLKVEGRMKSPEYVATVTRVYRAAIDRALAGGQGATDAERGDLAEAFTRGFTTAYLAKDRSMDMMSPKRPNNRGVRVGRVKGLRDGLVTLALDSDVAVGDVLEYWTGRGAVAEKVERLLLGGREVDEAPAGSAPAVVVSRPVAPGDRVFRVQNARLAARAKESWEGFAGAPREVSFAVRCRVGEPLAVEVSDASGRCGRAEGPVVEPARTRSVSAADIREHVGRLGGTPYAAVDWSVDVSEGAGVGFSLLHRLRREALSAYEEQLLEPWSARTEAARPQIAEPERAQRPTPVAKEGDLLVSVLVSAANAGAVAKALAGQTAARIEVDAVELAFDDPARADALREALGGGRVDGALVLPAICHDGRDQRVLELVEAQGLVVADSVSMLAAAVERGARAEAGPHVPVWNREAVEQVAELGAGAVWLSPELSLAQIADLASASPLPLGLTIYGAQELMVAEHCFLMSIGPCAQACATCPRRASDHWLLDRKGYRFPVTTDAGGRGHIHNSVPLDAVPQLPELVDAGVSAVRVDVSLLESEQAVAAVRRVLEARRLALSTGEALQKMPETTTGHLFRGVL